MRRKYIRSSYAPDDNLYTDFSPIKDELADEYDDMPNYDYDRGSVLEIFGEIIDRINESLDYGFSMKLLDYATITDIGIGSNSSFYIEFTNCNISSVRYYSGSNDATIYSRASWENFNIKVDIDDLLDELFKEGYFS